MLVVSPAIRKKFTAGSTYKSDYVRTTCMVCVIRSINDLHFLKATTDMNRRIQMKEHEFNFVKMVQSSPQGSCR